MTDATSLSFSPGDQVSVLMAVYGDNGYERNERVTCTVRALDGPLLSIEYDNQIAIIDLREYDIKKL